MQYEVYLDVLFLENMMMDFLILLAVKKVFPCSATYGSLLSGSFTGSLLTCAILFFPCPVWTRYILLFFLVNSYTTGLAPAVLTYMLATELKPWKGNVESQEIGLPVTESGLVLPCGASGRWSSSR